MANIEITCSMFKEWASAIDMRPYSYSGRGMRGRSCVGITVEQYGEINSAFSLQHALIKEALNGVMDGITEEDGDYQSAANDLLDAMDEVVKGIRTDNMGHDTVVYFTTIEWVEDEEDQESTCDTET